MKSPATASLQDFAKAGADMFTFHIESVVPETSTLSSEVPHSEVSELCGLVRAAEMHVGITIKPETPVDVVFPYVQAGLVDMVRPAHEDNGGRPPNNLKRPFCPIVGFPSHLIHFVVPLHCCRSLSRFLS